jgi:hypothetical protein
MMSYEYYVNMASVEKDKICDGENMQAIINQSHQQQQTRTTVKRMATSEGQRFGSNDEDEQTQGQWQNTRSNKQRRGNDSKDRDDRPLITVPRTFTNSNHNSQINLVQNHNNDQNTGINNYIKIFKYALDYASEYHYTPFKIICQPKTERY